MAGVEQLKLDLEEIKRLIPLAARQRIKGVLSVEMSRIEAEIAHQHQLSSVKSGGDAANSKSAKEQKPAVKELSTATIKTYGWDQSEKFVKMYVTVNDVQSIPASDVTVEFTQQSFKLLVQGLRDSNHQLAIIGLLNSIIPNESHYKVKTDSVVIFLKKQEQGKWTYLTQVEQRIKDKGKTQSKPDMNADPSGGVMDMMKKMYDEGDDEMKRTIAKAWTESKDKQGGMGMGGMGMEGMGMEGMGM